MGTSTLGRELWRRKISRTFRNILTGEDKGEFGNLRGEQSNRCSEGKQNSPQSSLPNSTSQLRSGLHSCPLFRVGAGCSGFRSRSPGRAPALTALKIRWEGQYDTAEGVQGKDWASHRVKRSLQQGASNALHWWITRTHFKKCHRWDEQQLWIAQPQSQIYTELYKKGLNDPDNHDGVITPLQPDILECEVKRALGRITMNKDRGSDGISTGLFQILKEDAVKVLCSICQKFGKLGNGQRTGKDHSSFQSQRRAMPKNVQTAIQLHSFHLQGNAQNSSG